MGKYFGTDGFRGEANKELTAAKAFKVGRYIGWYYGQQHEDGRARIIIGKDTLASTRLGGWFLGKDFLFKYLGI